ncbi:MAG: DNA repair protein RadC [Bacilli bacterium]|nr:DNA repair protein RadC [Bacilli bacterium]
MRIKDIPALNRPRERAIQDGIQCLSLEELLAILIQNGSKGMSARETALEILRRYPTSSEILNLTLKQLLEIKGIGPAKAVEILSALELGKRLYLQIDHQKRFSLRSAKDIYLYTKHLFYEKKQEFFYCLYLNPRCEVIERRLLFMGTINRSVVHPREIFKYAYLSSASSIACVHNHPSGSIEPSIEDIRLTEALIQLGKLNAIPIVDHVIVGDELYYSFAEDGKILNL